MAKATCVDLGLYVEGLMSSLPDQRRSQKKFWGWVWISGRLVLNLVLFSHSLCFLTVKMSFGCFNP